MGLLGEEKPWEGFTVEFSRISWGWGLARPGLCNLWLCDLEQVTKTS